MLGVKGGRIFSTTLKTSKEVVKSFDGKTFEESIRHCDNLDALEKDICYMSAVAVYNNTVGRTDYCNLIRINYYRFTCLQEAK